MTRLLTMTLLVCLTSRLFIQCTTPPTSTKQSFNLTLGSLPRFSNKPTPVFINTTRLPKSIACLLTINTESTDVLTLYSHLAAATTHSGSLHDSVSLPDSTREYLPQQAVFFPYPVRLLDNVLVFDAQHSPIPSGAIIDQINRLIYLTMPSSYYDPVRY